MVTGWLTTVMSTGDNSDKPRLLAERVHSLHHPAWDLQTLRVACVFLRASGVSWLAVLLSRAASLWIIFGVTLPFCCFSSLFCLAQMTSVGPLGEVLQ